MFYEFGNLLNDYFPELEYSTWNYLEAGHGKGMPDGIGGTVKRTADRLVTEGKDMSSFEYLISSLKENLRDIHITYITETDIAKIREKIELSQVIPFKGTMKVHQVQ